MNCLYCKTPTEKSLKSGNYKIYCNKSCMHKYWTMERGLKAPERACEKCGTLYKPFSTKQRFCKTGCGVVKRVWFPKVAKQPKQIGCGTCGVLFYQKRITDKYCCANCAYSADLSRRTNKPKLKTCSFCKKDFKPYTSLDKFCSSDCRIKNQKSKRGFNWTEEQVARRIGSKNPAYRNGMFARGVKIDSTGMKLFQKNSKEIKQQMIDKSGFVSCEKCGISNPLFGFEAHHLVYRSEKPLHPNLHDKENIYILCKPCHNAYHKNKSMRNDLVISRGLDKIFGNDILDK